jgi:hypothetical protein
MSATPYKMKGNRCSLLTITRYCGKAGELSEQYGAGRAAAKSSAFHAICSNAPDKQMLLAKLSDEEKDDIKTWKRPADVDVNGQPLDYDSAQKELPIALDAKGNYCDPFGGEAITAGTLDMAWVRTIEGRRIAFVADIKKSKFTTLDGPASLQVHAYAWAYAKLMGCDAYVTGIWIAEDGEWLWGEMVELEDWDSLDIWQSIAYAAMNKGEASTGSHCRGCYGRMHCPEYLLPAALAETSLAVLATTELDNARAFEARGLLDRLAAVTKSAEENLKEWAVRNGGIRDGKGKVWKPVLCKGRTSVKNIDALVEAFPGAEKFVNQGGTYEQFRWGKE